MISLFGLLCVIPRTMDSSAYSMDIFTEKEASRQATNVGFSIAPPDYRRVIFAKENSIVHGKSIYQSTTGAGLLIAKLRLFESDLQCSGCILKRSVGQ